MRETSKTMASSAQVLSSNLLVVVIAIMAIEKIDQKKMEEACHDLMLMMVAVVWRVYGRAVATKANGIIIVLFMHCLIDNDENRYNVYFYIDVVYNALIIIMSWYSIDYTVLASKLLSQY